MFGIGGAEFIVIALVLLIFVGPKNLPPLFRKIGQITAEFKNASRELRNQLDLEVGNIESPRQMIREISKDLLDRAELPYKEAEQADRELRQAAMALQNDIQNTISPEPEGAESSEPGKLSAQEKSQ